MTNPEASHPPIGDWRAHLATLAAEAAAQGDTVVQAARAHEAEVGEAAGVAIAAAAEIVRGLPPINKEALGPLWPDQNQ